jgi:hypothetical protein
MGIGVYELVIILFILLLVLGVAVILILVALQLFRRTRDLESRLAKLEGEQDSNTK